jgi:TM2 domain-containing membrane protein YozV
LILSIVSIFVGGICLAIPALVIANGALAITNQMPGHPDAGTAKTAQIISWIIIGIFILVIGFIVMLIAGAGASGEF